MDGIEAAHPYKHSKEEEETRHQAREDIRCDVEEGVGVVDGVLGALWFVQKIARHIEHWHRRGIHRNLLKKRNVAR